MLGVGLGIMKHMGSEFWVDSDGKLAYGRHGYKGLGMRLGRTKIIEQMVELGVKWDFRPVFGIA